MRILFVHPSAQVSIFDVARGYRSALERAGHEVFDYSMRHRIEYHHTALPEHVRNAAPMYKMASETILNEALYCNADLVLVISGLNVHPVFLWLLNKVNIPAAVVLTESPYDDEQQKMWTDLTSEGVTAQLTVFTNDAYSARQQGWEFLPPSFDPAVHKPMPSNPEFECDVLMVGTGWEERQAFLEAVDWSGIDLRIYGVWPGLQNNPNSPLHRFHRPMVIDNAHVAEMYSSARICLNIHRTSDVAETPNPRIYEVAACKAFQLSDPRKGLARTFYNSIPTFNTPLGLQNSVRHYLERESLRLDLADTAHKLVQDHTFDNRVAALVAALPKPQAVGT